MIEIGGRRFNQVADWTVEQDWWLMQRVRKAGISEINVDSGDPEHIAEAVGKAVEAKLTESGVILEILGGLLIPEGKSSYDWTPAMAEETTKFISAQRGPESREAVRSAAAWATIIFFVNGLVCFKSSPASFSATDEAQARETKTSEQQEPAS